LSFAKGFLFFQGTAFAGDLPVLPSGLVELDISFSLISGGLIPASFEGLQNLEFLDLSGNAFNSAVPSVFATLPNLQFLYIQDAFITGDLSYMEGMPSMREHWIDQNQDLGGTIPAFIGDITTLESFSVTQSNLVGTLPVQLENLLDMISLWFYGNSLVSTIPSEYGVFAKMKIFRVEDNLITGTVPSTICALRSDDFLGGNLQVLGTDYTLSVSHSNIQCEKCLFFL
jgi:Leucine-rich repeat (LRR) protein